MAPMHDEPTEIFLWLDIATINEHQPEVFRKGISDTLLEAVGEIGHTMLIVSPWSEPIVLTRSVCLWEVYCTHVKECELTLCLSNDERMSYMRGKNLQDKHNSYGDVIAIMEVLGKIDSSKATAGSSKATEKIASAVEASCGFASLDEIVKARLLVWSELMRMEAEAAHKMDLLIYQDDSLNPTEYEGIHFVCDPKGMTAEEIRDRSRTEADSQKVKAAKSLLTKRE